MISEDLELRNEAYKTFGQGYECHGTDWLNAMQICPKTFCTADKLRLTGHPGETSQAEDSRGEWEHPRWCRPHGSRLALVSCNLCRQYCPAPTSKPHTTSLVYVPSPANDSTAFRYYQHSYEIDILHFPEKRFINRFLDFCPFICRGELRVTS